MCDFVDTVAEAGCRRFIVHARIAWLQGLSPKQNREIPPLRYEDVYRLKQDFPELMIEINGGITTVDEVRTHLNHVDGVMLGRAGYQNPYVLAELNELWETPVPTRAEILAKLFPYLESVEIGEPYRRWQDIFGVVSRLTGARKWRQALSGKQHLTVDEIRQAGER